MRSSLIAFTILVSALPGTYLAARPARASRASRSTSAFHIVRRGETAARIARDNGLTLDQLEACNPGLNLAKLTAGAKVRVHAAAKPAVHRVTAPMPPLPATPAPGPTSFTHMERILPVTVREAAAAAPALREAPSALGVIQPVLPAPAPVENAGFLPADRDHLDLLWPVETRTVSSAWGPRMRSKTVRVKHAKRKMRYRGSHKGVDLTAPKGTDVYAAMDGVVVTSGRQKGYGNYVVLDHGNGVMTLYGHHNRNLVTEGEVVRRGQKIAEVGRTGNATGPHLHFELRLDGAPTNPLPFLNDVEEIPGDQIARN